jgi:hypothetical protein
MDGSNERFTYKSGRLNQVGCLFGSQRVWVRPCQSSAMSGHRGLGKMVQNASGLGDGRDDQATASDSPKKCTIWHKKSGGPGDGV